MDIILATFADLGANLKTASQIMSYVWFIVLPPSLFYLFENLWLDYVREIFGAAPDWVVLELIPPKNIEKSPKPMEALFVGFAGVEKAFDTAETYIDGAFPDYMSLEIVSDQGSVHMYIRTMKKYRHLVEAHLYAQYPDVEIVEVPDYVHAVPKVIPNGQWDLWGADVAFTKNPAYPINTYKTFEENITGTMIDPLAGLMETMGKLGPGQQMWLQWIISPTKPSWASKDGKKLLEKLKGKEVVKKGMLEGIWQDFMDIITNIHKLVIKGDVEFPKEKKKDDLPLSMKLTPVELDVFKAVEENLGKIHFSTKGRFIYLGRRENYDKALGVSSFWGSLKQFGNDNMNGFKPDGDSKTFANFVFKKSRLRYRQRKLLRRYRNRSGAGISLVMSAEELATVFHLPDMNVMAPSLGRVEAKRGGAPSNLPIE